MLGYRSLGRSRILIYPPGHPLLIGVYVLLAFGLAIVASILPSIALSNVVTSRLHSVLLWIASYLILLSPFLSFINLVVKRVEYPLSDLNVEIEFVYVYGLPIAVPRLRLSKRVTLIAVNLGGALVPLFTSIILSWIIYSAFGSWIFKALAPSIITTSIATFAASRTVPGAGIAVPALIPPITASLTAIAIAGSGPVAAVSAYTGGVLGSLIGADLLRLLKDFEKLEAPIISIGGVGVFDGVFLSGVIGLILAL